MERYSDLFNEIKTLCESSNSGKVLSKSHIVKGKYLSTIETFEIKNINEAKYYNMNKGKYFLLTIQNILYEDSKKLLYYADIMSNRLVELFGKFNENTKFLILGLGNSDILADSLGVNVTKRIFVTRNFLDKNSTIPEVSVYNTNVLGVTGIESFDVAKSIVDIVKPNIVILIDSLCASDVKRLGKSFQISNIGLTPGAGINNPRIHFNFKNVKMISIGVPLVVYAKTFVRNWLDSIEKTNKLNTIQNLKKNLNETDFLTHIVTPKDIDEIVKNSAYIISSAINKSIFGKFEL